MLRQRHYAFNNLLFFPKLHNALNIPWTTTSFNCMCTHPINLMGIHFLLYAHGNECTKTEDAIHDIFVTIVRDANFHVG
jgi:hypothetical protein